MALVDKMYECFAKGDMATLKTDVFAPDITWSLPGHHPLSGIKNGPDEVIAFFGALMQTGIEVDNVTFGTMGDDEVVEKHTGHGILTTGEEIIFPTCSHYRSRTAASPKSRSTRRPAWRGSLFLGDVRPQADPGPARRPRHSKAEDPNVPLRTDKA